MTKRQWDMPVKSTVYVVVDDEGAEHERCATKALAEEKVLKLSEEFGIKFTYHKRSE